MLDFGYCLGRKDIVCRSIMLRRCLVGRMSHHAVGGVKIDVETLAGVRVRIAQLVERRVFQAMCTLLIIIYTKQNKVKYFV